MNLTTKIGIVGLLSILLTTGAFLTFTPEELQGTYYCPLTDEIGVFERLSRSGKTGYYTINQTEYGRACRQGRTYTPWEHLSETKTTQWQCNSQQCIPI